jgi:hypothetical protein
MQLDRTAPGYNARQYQLVLKMKAGFHSNDPLARSFPPSEITVEQFLVPSGYTLGFHTWLFTIGEWWYRWVPAKGKQFWQELIATPTKTSEIGNGDFHSGIIPADEKGSNARPTGHKYTKPTWAISDILTCITFQQYGCPCEDYCAKFRFCKSY